MTVFLALFCPIAAAAQTPNQPMSEKVCERQGKLYVTERTRTNLYQTLAGVFIGTS
jgi:hypothetical protein